MEEFIERMSENNNFWEDAINFTDSILPADFGKRFMEYCKRKKFNSNEMQFFKLMISEAIEVECSIAILKEEYTKYMDNKKNKSET